MPKRKSRTKKPEIIGYRAEVTGTSVHISAHGAGIKYNDPSPSTDTFVEIFALLQYPEFSPPPKICFTVACREKLDDSPATVLNIKPFWSVMVHLPKSQFDHLLVLITSKRLGTVQFAAEKPYRGKTFVRSILFSTTESFETFLYGTDGN